MMVVVMRTRSKHPGAVEPGITMLAIPAPAVVMVVVMMVMLVWVLRLDQQGRFCRCFSIGSPQPLDSVGNRFEQLSIRGGYRC